MEIQTDMLIDRLTKTEYSQTNKQNTDRWKDNTVGQTNKQKYRQTERQPDRWTIKIHTEGKTNDSNTAGQTD